MVGVLPGPHGFGHRARAPAPGPTKSGCHVVDVSPRSRRKAAPARARRAALERSGVDAPYADDSPADDLLGELENLDNWLTQRIPVVPDDVHDLPTECFAAVPAREPVAPPRRGRALVRAAVVVVLTILVAGSATAVAADKTVVVTVDGQDRIVHTFAGDVAGRSPRPVSPPCPRTASNPRSAPNWPTVTA